MGCYPVSFSTLLAKLTSNFDYQNIKVLNKKLDIGDTGVDLDSYAEIDFGNDFKSYIGASFSKNLGKSTKIKGTESNLIIEDTWQADSSCIKIIGKKNQEIKVNSYKNIYCNEIEILSNCLLENKKFPSYPGLSIEDSYENMKILDKWIN